MAKAKNVKAAVKKSPSKLGLLKSATKKMATATAKLVKAATKIAPAAKAVAKPEAKAAAAAPAKVPKVPEKAKAAAPAAGAEKEKAKPEKPAKAGRAAPIPAADRPRPRATKLPPQQEALTKREMEQVLTVGQGRGVTGEGSLKGRLAVKEEFPYLLVIGRDKRELSFLLQGPDQEVLPAYLDHKVSVSGLIRKTHNYGGTVDVRKYSAKKPELEIPVPEVVEEKLRFLSPGELEQMCNPGMGAGMKGFGSLRGNLEMTGEDFFLVVSNAGTRQQVSFLLEGKGSKGLRKQVGQTVFVQGVLEKSSGWGGKVGVENVEPRPSDQRSMSRDNMEIVHLEGGGDPVALDVKINQGLTVRLPEKPGFTWAIEPTTAKRVGLREANFEPSHQGPGTREFFFTPRNPGLVEVDFFLAKAFTPAQVSKTFRITVNVKP